MGRTGGIPPDRAPVAERPPRRQTPGDDDVVTGVSSPAETRSSSAEEMAQVLAVGMEEGIRLAVGQIDALLAERPA